MAGLVVAQQTCCPTLYVLCKQNANRSQNQAWKSSALTALPADGFPPIEPLPDFDWKNTEPEKLRPFLGREGRYNLTMGRYLSRGWISILDRDN